VAARPQGLGKALAPAVLDASLGDPKGDVTGRTAQGGSGTDPAQMDWATRAKGPATLSAEPPWITPGKIEFQGKGTL